MRCFPLFVVVYFWDVPAGKDNGPVNAQRGLKPLNARRCPEPLIDHRDTTSLPASHELPFYHRENGKYVRSGRVCARENETATLGRKPVPARQKDYRKAGSAEVATR
jgi:hypothetical protein